MLSSRPCSNANPPCRLSLGSGLHVTTLPLQVICLLLQLREPQHRNCPSFSIHTSHPSIAFIVIHESGSVLICSPFYTFRPSEFTSASIIDRESYITARSAKIRGLAASLLLKSIMTRRSQPEILGKTKEHIFELFLGATGNHSNIIRKSQRMGNLSSLTQPHSQPAAGFAGQPASRPVTAPVSPPETQNRFRVHGLQVRDGLTQSGGLISKLLDSRIVEIRKWKILQTKG